MSIRMMEGSNQNTTTLRTTRETTPPPRLAYRIVFRKQLDDNTCANCETQYRPEDLEVLRRVPIEDGGTNKTTNLLTVCEFCESDVRQAGQLNLPESARQEPADSSDEDTHRVLSRRYR